MERIFQARSRRARIVVVSKTEVLEKVAEPVARHETSKCPSCNGTDRHRRPVLRESAFVRTQHVCRDEPHKVDVLMRLDLLDIPQAHAYLGLWLGVRVCAPTLRREELARALKYPLPVVSVRLVHNCFPQTLRGK